jgi:hypothetical protein
MAFGKAMLARMTPSPVPAETAVGATLPEVLDFIASIVGSIAWPVVVLTLLLIFRDQIKKLATAIKDRMPAVERLKTPWGEMVWSSSAVQQVSTEVDASLPARRGDSAGEQRDSRAAVAKKLARVEPSAGVIHAFLDVERNAGAFLTAMDILWRGSPIVTFRRTDAVPTRLRRLVAELAALRNAAAHGVGDVSLESALEYVDSAERVAAELRSLTDDVLAERPLS